MIRAPEADVRRAVEVLLQDPEECAALMFDTPGDAFDPVSKVMKPSSFPSCQYHRCIVDPPLDLAFAITEPLHPLNCCKLYAHTELLSLSPSLPTPGRTFASTWSRCAWQ